MSDFEKIRLGWGWIVIVILVFALLSTVAYCQENCYPTPSPLPPDGTIQIGTEVLVPLGGEMTYYARTSTGSMCSLLVKKWNLTVGWTATPDWYLTDQYTDQFWLLDDYPNTYCRFDCNNLNTDPQASADWHCTADCFAVGDATIQYTIYDTRDCWTSTQIPADQSLIRIESIGLPIRGRATNRLTPGQ